MVNIEKLSEEIKNKIISEYKELKTKLFESNGKIFGRDWEDLTPKYKKWKIQKKGSAYPINILTGDLLKSVLDNALVIDIFYDTHLDKLNYKINIDSDKIGLSYADDVNKKREYILFSPEEKEIIIELVIQTIKNYFEEMQ